ncbi:hypothetical protein LQG66_25815 [Bradyrhizobium ontarionense]|uniref:Transcriptional regulator n=1 Tax=Bradyrhizobium ontarionense TaxID=2898149 RepID=A0ABY3R7D4_9BRAD|nr:hypothetical protein [Bradyrhizobium sp. A19]UFZ02673.1 hypothetical protein LQG66_25815 [Bradyrhizobium sp. A19]
MSEMLQARVPIAHLIRAAFPEATVNLDATERSSGPLKRRSPEPEAELVVRPSSAMVGRPASPAVLAAGAIEDEIAKVAQHLSVSRRSRAQRAVGKPSGQVEPEASPRTARSRFAPRLSASDALKDASSGPARRTEIHSADGSTDSGQSDRSMHFESLRLTEIVTMAPDIPPPSLALAPVEAESAPNADRRWSRRAAMAAVVLLGILATGAEYWRRAQSESSGGWGAASPAVARADEFGPHKVSSERILPDARPVTVGRSAGQGASAPAQAVLYQEDARNAQGKRYLGKVSWRFERAAATKSPGVLKADIELDNHAKVALSLRRNVDSELPASHVMELTFEPPADPSAPVIAAVKGITMKGSEVARGVPLSAQTAKVTSKFFMVALSAVDVDTKRNLVLLKGKSWFDIPIVYEGGARALLSIEKGPDGDLSFKDAFAAWEQ